MKKLALFILLAGCTLSVTAQRYQNLVDEDGNAVGPMRVPERTQWFSDGYVSYTPNSSAVDVLRNLPANTSFLVFGGAWCSDTQDLLPKFYKVTDLAGIKRTRIQLYFLGKNKTSPGALESQYGVTQIPTFIILQNGKEVGRVVERVNTSIENDLVEVSGFVNR